jgi:thioredoxin domain-containing protein 10
MEILLLFVFTAEPVNKDLGLEYLNASMYEWINAERFATFPKVTSGNIDHLLQTKKYLVLAVVEENKLQEIPTEMLV